MQILLFVCLSSAMPKPFPGFFAKSPIYLHKKNACKGRRHRTPSVPFGPIRPGAALAGFGRGPTLLAAARFALEQMGPKWALRSGKGQICGRCAKEKGGIPAVVYLPAMTMQLPQYAPFRAMGSHAAAPNGAAFILRVTGVVFSGASRKGNMASAQGCPNCPTPASAPRSHPQWYRPAAAARSP